MDKVLLRVAVVFSVKKQNQGPRRPEETPKAVLSLRKVPKSMPCLQAIWPATGLAGCFLGLHTTAETGRLRELGHFSSPTKLELAAGKHLKDKCTGWEAQRYITVRCFSPLSQLSVETAWHCWVCSKGRLCSSGPDSSTPAGLHQPGDPCVAAGVPPMESTALEILPGSCASPL